MHKKSRFTIQLDKSLITDNCEAYLDIMLSDGFLKEIPMIGNFIKSYSAVKNIPNTLFLNKLANFFQGTNLSDEDLKNIRSMVQTEEERNQLGAKILLVLNNITENERAYLAGKSFTALAHDFIDKNTFYRIFHVLENCLFIDLEQFARSKHHEQVSENITVLPLSALGLYAPSNSIYGIGNDYHKTDFGYTVTYILFDIPRPTETVKHK